MPGKKDARKIIQTKKIETIFEDLECTIVEYRQKYNLNRTKLVKPGIFSSSYELYVIKTPAHGWVVERREEQFRILQKTLRRYYPGFVVPLLPKKPCERLEPIFIKAHQVKLQLFLNGLTKQPLLRNSDAFVKFLTLPGEKEFDAAIGTIEKKNCPLCPADCFTLEGQANVSRSKELQDFCRNIQKGLEKLEGNFKE